MKADGTDTSKPSRMSRRGIIVGLIIVNVVVLSISFAIGEVYLRRHSTHIIQQQHKSLPAIVPSDPAYVMNYTIKGRRLVPNARVIIKNHFFTKRDITMNINSHGFRDKEIAENKPANETRILVLGDSITFGDYLQSEEIYVQRMEHYLNRAYKDRMFNVINAGVGDIGLKEEMYILEEQGLSVNPDIVMVAFYLNDSRPPWGFPGELGSSGFLRSHSILIAVAYRKIKLWKWIRDTGKDRYTWINEQYNLNWRNDKDDFMKLVDAAKYDWGAAWSEESWRLVDKQLKKLHGYSKKHGFDIVILSFPVSYQVYSEFLEDNPQKVLKQKAENLNFHYIDLLPLLRKYNANKELFYDMCHPTVSTNDLIGRAVADFYMDNVFPDTPASGK